MQASCKPRRALAAAVSMILPGDALQTGLCWLSKLGKSAEENLQRKQSMNQSRHFQNTAASSPACISITCTSRAKRCRVLDRGYHRQGLSSSFSLGSAFWKHVWWLVQLDDLDARQVQGSCHAWFPELHEERSGQAAMLKHFAPLTLLPRVQHMCRPASL